MSHTDSVLGDCAPDNNRERHAIWKRAVSDFIWPNGPVKAEDVACSQHPIFSEWTSDMGVRMRLFPGAASYFENYRTTNEFLAKRSDIHPGDGMACGVRLKQIWESTWRGMVAVDEGGGSMRPAPRQALRGLKFCLLYHVLRCGLHDGTPPTGNTHRLVKWTEAQEAASFLLALSVLPQIELDAEYELQSIPWLEVKGAAAVRLAAAKLAVGAAAPTDLGDFEDHARSEGINGYRKRLRASMDETSFKRITVLANGFEKQGKRGLVKWRDSQNLSRWFVCGRD